MRIPRSASAPRRPSGRSAFDTSHKGTDAG
jgi:hypothetical protein